MNKRLSSVSVLAIIESCRQQVSLPIDSSQQLFLRKLTRVEKNNWIAKYSEGDTSLPWFAVLYGNQIVVVSDDYVSLLRAVREEGGRLLDLSQLG